MLFKLTKRDKNQITNNEKIWSHKRALQKFILDTKTYEKNFYSVLKLL